MNSEGHAQNATTEKGLLGDECRSAIMSVQYTQY